MSAGGEGRVREKDEQVEAVLLVLGIEAGVVGKADVDGERRLAGSEHGGGVTPVGFGRREVAGKLR